jgi:hypothetical protein
MLVPRSLGGDEIEPRTAFATLIASVSLGIARHAIEAFKELAGVKKPTGSQELLRTSPVAQSQLGQAEGLLRRAARSSSSRWQMPGRSCVAASR